MTLRRHHGRESGWTLIELTIVISLMTILSTIALVGYRSAITRTREAVLKEDLFRMRDAIDQYYADRQEYPPALQSLVTEGYLRAMPDDPFTGSSDTRQPIFCELDPADPLAQGLFDVKSTFEQTSQDATQYAVW